MALYTPASEPGFFDTSEIIITDVMAKAWYLSGCKDPEDKGRIASYSGWTLFNQIKINEYGLGDLYTNFDPGALDPCIC